MCFFFRNVETENQSVSASVQIAQTCIPKGAAAINGQFDEGIQLFEAPVMCRKKPHPMTDPWDVAGISTYMIFVWENVGKYMPYMDLMGITLHGFAMPKGSWLTF